MNFLWNALGLILFLSIFIIILIGFHELQRNLSDEIVEEYDPDEYHKARKAYLQAQANFDQAEPMHVDVSIYDLNSAECRFGNELRRLKK